MFKGVLVATATPFAADGRVDYDRYGEHCAWMIDHGVHGLVPNGSLGEYQALDDEERARLVEVAVDASAGRAVVVPGVGSPAGHTSRRWAEQAAKAGAHGVMALPPTGYRASREEVLTHFREVAAAGLPVVVYNNPFDTRVDLTPGLLAEIAEIDGIVGVKEFSGDVRRVSEILDAAPGLQVICGSDDVVLESLLAGATGWIAGFTNAFPVASVRLFELGRSGHVTEALPMYRELLPAFRWDSRPQFVQAIKLALDMVGRYGGPCRLPRLPLAADAETAVRQAVERALVVAQ
jgi:1-pyrroline-4-hydroxy-2-carboxylate deaminase